MPSIRSGLGAATAFVCAVVAFGLGVSGQQPSGIAGETMVGVQDLAWSRDGRTLFFSAMRVKRDYSDYAPDKWSVWRYDAATRRLALFAADENTGSSLYSRIGTTHMSTPCLRDTTGSNAARCQAPRAGPR
jgi:hypothetical protein